MPCVHEKGRPEAPFRNSEGAARGLVERLDNRFVDAVGLERLDDEVAGAELDRLEDLGLLPEGGAHDHPGGGVDRDDLLEGGEAVLLGHRDVERGHLGTQLLVAGDTAERSSSVSSTAASAAGSPPPIIAAARRRAPSSVITNRLPPVTPST